MTDKGSDLAGAQRRCESCRAEIGPNDRFCRACGAALTSDAGKPRAQKSRRHAAVMLVLGFATVVFAAVHRDPADLILVFAFGMPLCGAGAVTWSVA
jgi:predicted amidophosphoribosyltransferase